MARLLSRQALWGAVALLAPSIARGDTNRVVRLLYEQRPGTEGCPGADAIRRVVSGHLGRDPFDLASPRVLLARIEVTAGGLRARILLREGDRIVGERDLAARGSDCGELASSLTLAIALAIDPLVTLPKTVADAGALPIPPGAPPAPPVAAVDKRASEPVAIVDGRAKKAVFRLGLGAHGATGVLPAPAAGPAVSASLRRGRASLWLDMRWDLAPSRALEAGELGGTAVLGALAGCAHLARVGACGVVAAGALRVWGADLGEAIDGRTRPLVHAGPRLAVDLASWGPVSLLAHAELLVALTRTTVEVDNRPVWTTPRASAGGGISAMMVVP